MFDHVYLRKIAIMPEKGTLYFCGVAEKGNEMMNLKASLQPFFKSDGSFLAGEFLELLKETLAKDFDVHTWKVNIQDEVVVGKIMSWQEKFVELGLV